MSYKLVDLCFDIPGLTQGEQCVLVAICRHADNTNYACFPSRELLAKVSRVQVRQVQRILPTLISKGFITYTAGKGRAPNKYTVQVDFIRKLIDREDIKTPLGGDQQDKVENSSGDIKALQDSPVVVTLTPSCEGICDRPLGTFATASGDIDASLYKKNLLGIGQKESVSAIGKASAHREGKKFALSLIGQLAELTDESLGELANKIACRHPRSRLRNWTARNVAQADTVAILDAMQDEAQQTGTTMAEAGRMMLSLLDAWDDIPREKWQFVAAIPRFYKQGDYRLEPQQLPGFAPKEGKKPHGKRRGKEGNAGALQEFLAGSDTAGEGDSALAGDVGGGVGEDSQPVDVPAVRGGAVGPDAGGTGSGLFPRRGGVQVLSRPSYPPRIQRPRHIG